jgi:cold shock CspA family protein
VVDRRTTKGTLVRFVPGRFGIIAPDKGITVFVHHSKLYEGAREGDYLEFVIGEGDKGFFAYDCKPARKRAKA